MLNASGIPREMTAESNWSLGQAASAVRFRPRCLHTVQYGQCHLSPSWSPVTPIAPADRASSHRDLPSAQESPSDQAKPQQCESYRKLQAEAGGHCQTGTLPDGDTARILGPLIPALAEPSSAHQTGADTQTLLCSHISVTPPTPATLSQLVLVEPQCSHKAAAGASYPESLSLVALSRFSS